MLLVYNIYGSIYAREELITRQSILYTQFSCTILFLCRVGEGWLYLNIPYLVKWLK